MRLNFFEMDWITHRQNSRISLGRKQHYAACMPVKLFSQSVSPVFRFKNSIPKHRANNLPPRIPCFVRKWKTTRAKNILWLWPASTWYRLAFHKFSGRFDVCKLIYLSANFLPVQLVRPLGSNWRSQRSIQTTLIKARIVLTTQWIDWQDKGALERPATLAGISSHGRTPWQNTIGFHTPFF